VLSGKYKIILSITIFIVIGGICSYPIKEQWKKDHEKIVVSPKEIIFNAPANKDFVLSIINNQEVAVYNVCLGICLNSRTNDFTAIKIKSVIEELLPGIPLSPPEMSLSNGCYVKVIGYIKPYSTKELYITIEGKKLKTGSKVAFRVYNWYLEPHFESTKTDKEYALRKDPPKNFKDVFNNKLSESEKTGHVYYMKIKLPTNTYFPEDKDDTKEYWVAFFTDF
jgi:hypothetical protein